MPILGTVATNKCHYNNDIPGYVLLKESVDLYLMRLFLTDLNVIQILRMLLTERI